MPFIGRWRADEDDGRSEYHVFPRDPKIGVRGFDFCDGEEHETSEVQLHDYGVSFKSIVRSINRSGIVRIQKEGGSLRLIYTLKEPSEANRV